MKKLVMVWLLIIGTVFGIMACGKKTEQSHNEKSQDEHLEEMASSSDPAQETAETMTAKGASQEVEEYSEEEILEEHKELDMDEI